jgi:hypothetical protein
MPWRPLAAGCVTGLAISLAAHRFLGAGQPAPATLLALRVAFVPVVAGISVLASDQQRQFMATLPAPAWLLPALHAAAAAPVVAATTALQLKLAAAGLSRGVALPWPSLAGELAAWSAIAFAAGAAVARTRWTDLGGAIAAPATLGLIGLLAVPAWRLLPRTFGQLTPAQHQHWAASGRTWWVLALAAAAAAGAASCDPWLTVRSRGSGHRHG